MTKNTLQIAIMILLVGCTPNDRPATETNDAIPVDAADTVYTNGKIYTVNEDQPWAEAVAIKDGRFVYVGNDAGVTQFIGPSTQKAELAGRLVIPGIVDGHTHPGYNGAERFGTTLPETNPEDFLKAVQDYSEIDGRFDGTVDVGVV